MSTQTIASKLNTDKLQGSKFKCLKMELFWSIDCLFAWMLTFYLKQMKIKLVFTPVFFYVLLKTDYEP